MDKLITIYHGSKQIVEMPTLGEGKKNNDFGLGFYCTESNDLAKEWAVSSLRDGFSNRYTLDTEYLNIISLNNPDYTILNWVAVLVAHRLFSIKTPVARRAQQYLIDNFGVNVNAYDLITTKNLWSHDKACVAGINSVLKLIKSDNFFFAAGTQTMELLNQCECDDHTNCCPNKD